MIKRFSWSSGGWNYPSACPSRQKTNRLLPKNTLLPQKCKYLKVILNVKLYNVEIVQIKDCNSIYLISKNVISFDSHSQYNRQTVKFSKNRLNSKVFTFIVNASKYKLITFHITNYPLFSVGLPITHSICYVSRLITKPIKYDKRKCKKKQYWS